MANKHYGNHSFTGREAENKCEEGERMCASVTGCYSESEWCDGNVNCEDASDEAHCPCKNRVNKSRLCDNFYDCPLGEDEMGCFSKCPLNIRCN